MTRAEQQLREQLIAPPLDVGDLAADPVEQFAQWLDQARSAGVELADVATLATATNDGVPSARTVAVRGYDPRGFVFYTDARSEKGRQLQNNPRAELVFYWRELHRQVRVFGAVGQLTDDEVDEYFAARPRDSQLAAVASPQSEPLADRAALEQRFQAAERTAGDGPVQRPSFWCGYRVASERLIFWQGRPNRMHDRFRYTATANGTGWTVERLAP